MTVSLKFTNSDLFLISNKFTYSDSFSNSNSFSYSSKFTNSDLFSSSNYFTESNRIPVSDLLHLFKNAWSHMLEHILCLDIDAFKCLNMHEFEKNVQIGQIILERSNIAAMTDSYCFKLFSCETMTKWLSKQRFDGVFYILPFVYIVQTTRSKKLCIYSYLNLLKCAIKYFTFHLNNVKKSKTDNFFNQTYKASSFGTLFNDEIFLIRCINTCLAFKSFFISSINNQICNRFDFQISIAKRDNDDGVTIYKKFYQWNH